MLEKQRQQIDSIDQQLVALFEERLAVAEEIAQVKYQGHLGLTDRGREAVLLENLINNVANETYKPYIKDLYRDIFLVSKQLQANTIKKLQDADR
ncbi:chorismate mutase [Agrilactobacillus yilanensis]|uniref:Chorismate mutase n=1 Tax=Agrilactobacillus yilanensis TaxID=2485997 RepID=A0ABW4J504_9LACO|nr:chorismate mutase [Agrilactobacillus yilanensis]